MIELLNALIKLFIVIPCMIVIYLFAFLVVAITFIGIAALFAAPFILIIGLVLWIFF